MGYLTVDTVDRLGDSPYTQQRAICCRRVHPLTVQTLSLYSYVGHDLKQVQRARENALKLVAEATELSPGLDHFRESSRAFFASFGSSPTGLYSKGVNPSEKSPALLSFCPWGNCTD